MPWKQAAKDWRQEAVFWREEAVHQKWMFRVAFGAFFLSAFVAGMMP